MKLKTVDHIAIIGSDIEKSKGFYIGVLGFEVLKETFREERNSWKVDLEMPQGVKIELFTFPEAPQRVTNPEALGLRHLAFGVESVEDALEELKEKGVQVEDQVRIDPVTGKKFAFFFDPDQLPLEIYETGDSETSSE